MTVFPSYLLSSVSFTSHPSIRLATLPEAGQLVAMRLLHHATVLAAAAATGAYASSSSAPSTYLTSVSANCSSAPQSSSLPVVDLGYERHQAAFFNVGLQQWLAHCARSSPSLTLVHWWLLQLLKHPLRRSTSRRSEI